MEPPTKKFKPDEGIEAPADALNHFLNTLKAMNPADAATGDEEEDGGDEAILDLQRVFWQPQKKTIMTFHPGQNDIRQCKTPDPNRLLSSAVILKSEVQG